MTANMDVSLDEILAERKSERRGNRSRNDRNDRNDRNGGRSGRRDRDRRDDYPRDGVRKVGKTGGGMAQRHTGRWP
ncbi:uncharacterized protein SPSK_11016 [Sporothrix schenckii 1099-18]|uniref:Uncharacterized protein n=1 Tax=Sporothrix schenckii 1099-18 TaxID=1397361 RepID=A0A0F2MAE4_SPOSC|nr:uncharacterized protein SPSK_11016 [Sporothrix schenckii 1099-18]KJR85800.1 hypothetical protein SPSK_11016 [Sporothrix schenckii 1099-18]